MCPVHHGALKGYREKKQTIEVLQEARLFGKMVFSHHEEPRAYLGSDD